MKKSVYILVCLGAVACTKETKITIKNPEKGAEKKASHSTQSVTYSTIHTIPVSTVPLGVFPYLDLPQGTQTINNPLEREIDEVYFPIGDSLHLISGKLYKTFIERTENSEWSMSFFLKTYDDAIKAKGGALIFKGKLRPDQLDFIKENAKYIGEEGSIDYWNEPVYSYIIRQPHGDDVYIQLYANNASGAIQIVQQLPRKESSLMTNDTITNAL